jgi:hypothetical protein
MKLAGASAREIEIEIRRGVDANPQSTEIAELLFLELLSQKDYSKARELIDRLDGMVTKETVSLANMRADRALIDDDLDAARMEYERALQLMTDESDPDAVFRLAVALLVFPGGEDQGIAVLERLATAGGDSPAPYAYLAVWLETKNPDRARALLGQARKRWGRRRGFERAIAEIRESQANPNRPLPGDS